jgi:hypothetical protein
VRGARVTGARGAVAGLAVATIVAAACAQRDNAAELFPLASARAMLVRLDDLPAGFREGPRPPVTGPDDEAARPLRICAREGFVFDPRIRRVRSPQYVDVSNRTVSSEVSLEPTDAHARAVLAQNADEASVRCLAHELYGPFAAEEPEVRRLAFRGLGDGSTAWRVTFTEPGSGLRIHIDQVIVRVGRLQLVVAFISSDARFTPAEEQDLVRALLARAPG